MATVNVTNWSEFVAAVAVSGDTVVCPENAVWDMNEIAPEGVAGFPVNCTEIQGQGTEIKNLRVSSPILIQNDTLNQAISDLHTTNFVAESGPLFTASGNTNGMYATFSSCKFSGLLPQNARYFLQHNRKYGVFSRCSFTLDMQYNATPAVMICEKFTYGPYPLKFCRMHIQLPNGALFYPNAEWSYVRIDCPGMVNLNVSGAAANVYDGDLPQLTGVTGTASATYPSVYNSDSMPQFSGAANVLGVTEAQLRDPAYLSSIGFPIGVEV